MEQIQVYPDKKGEWRWRHRAGNGKVVADSGEGYELRADAIAAAREQAGVETLKVVREDGTQVGIQRTEAKCPVVLLRPDGSVYGELTPGPSSGGPAQHVDLKPASEQGKAT